MRLNNKEFNTLITLEEFLPSVIDLTEDIFDAMRNCSMTPFGMESYEDYIDFKQLSLDYDMAVVEGKYYFIGKFGLGEEVIL